MSDLVEFLRARVDDDERIAAAAFDGAPLSPEAADNGQVQNWGPERALRECQAKRAIVDELERCEEVYTDAKAQLAAVPDDQQARVARDAAANALNHSRVAALAVARIWQGYPGFRQVWRG